LHFSLSPLPTLSAGVNNSTSKSGNHSYSTRKAIGNIFRYNNHRDKMPPERPPEQMPPPALVANISGRESYPSQPYSDAYTSANPFNGVDYAVIFEFGAINN